MFRSIYIVCGCHYMCFHSWNFIYLACHITRFGDLFPQKMAMTHLSSSSFVCDIFFLSRWLVLQQHKEESDVKEKNTRHCLIIQFNWFTKVTHKEAKIQMMCSVKVLALVTELKFAHFQDCHFFALVFSVSFFLLSLCLFLAS